ncbi:MAG TPA: ADP-ribosylglycohydrolase family protein [Candidatus Bathyarchaeia archaeon]|nr:ADP-ribosylglycohydrolase family protein [Candidatus Bathyarchaeia archaeon]
MLGAIAGDIIGSVHEFACGKSMDFPLFVKDSCFTDDSVLTVAVAECLLTGASYADKFREYTLAYPGRGYGGMFYQWATRGNRMPYNSWGNGSAMRVSPVAFAFEDLESVLHEASRTAVVTHNHPEGLRGAKATAAATFLARKGSSKAEIRRVIESRFEYDLGRPIAVIRETYEFNESCKKTVPEAITAFLDSKDYEDAIRLAISLGGDADTLACIAGGIAGAFYGGVPQPIAEPAWALLSDHLRRIVTVFHQTYKIPQALPPN